MRFSSLAFAEIFMKCASKSFPGHTSSSCKLTSVSGHKCHLLAVIPSGNHINVMSRRVSGYNFVEPTILKILKSSTSSLSTLAINYHVNIAVGRTINLNVIKKNLMFLVAHRKISERLEANGVTYYKQIL